MEQKEGRVVASLTSERKQKMTNRAVLMYALVMNDIDKLKAMLAELEERAEIIRGWVKEDEDVSRIEHSRLPGDTFAGGGTATRN